MMQRHALIYLGSKIAAACLNLAALAVFARVAGPAGYGEYLVALAWAYVVHGFAVQWLRISFFAAYDTRNSAALIATYGRMLAGLVAGIGVLAALAAVAGLVAPRMALEVAALAAALAIYDSAHEIGRTRLRAEAVGTTVLLRAALVLVFGAVTLKSGGSPAALAVAVAAAHLVATLPLWRDIGPFLMAEPSRTEAQRLMHFGWPLIPAYGAGALGANADRLLLERIAGLAAVGPYGAVSDLIRQLMVVVPEAVASSYFAIAKAAHACGDEARAQATLESAFRAHAAVLSFGAAALATFAQPLVALLMGADYAGAAAGILAWIIAATTFAVLRSFYFGQVIFFSGASRLELISAAALLVVSVVAGLALIPWRDVEGAAAALALGNLAALLVSVIAGRRLYAMPMPVRDTAGIVALALAAWAVAKVAALAGAPLAPKLIVAALALTGCGLAAIWRYDVLELRGTLAAAVARLRFGTGR